MAGSRADIFVRFDVCGLLGWQWAIDSSTGRLDVHLLCDDCVGDLRDHSFLVVSSRSWFVESSVAGLRLCFHDGDFFHSDSIVFDLDWNQANWSQ